MTPRAKPGTNIAGNGGTTPDLASGTTVELTLASGVLGAVLTLAMLEQAAGPLPGLCLALAVVLAGLARGFRRPPVWLIVLSLAPALTLPWTADMANTALSALRVSSLSYLLWTLRRDLSPLWLAAGAGLVLGVQAIVIAPGIDDARQSGLARHITILSVVGLAAYAAAPARPRWLMIVMTGLAALTAAAAGSRAPIPAVIASGGLSGPLALARGILIGIAVFTVAVWQGSGYRFLGADSLGTDTQMRIATMQPDGGGTWVAFIGGSAERQAEVRELTCAPAARAGRECGSAGLSWTGAGAGAYLALNPWPRPHNVPALAIHELGVFSALLFGVFAWAAVTGRISPPAAALLVVHGLLDDSLISQPEGHYAVALILTADYAGRAGGRWSLGVSWARCAARVLPRRSSA